MPRRSISQEDRDVKKVEKGWLRLLQINCIISLLRDIDINNCFYKITIVKSHEGFIIEQFFLVNSLYDFYVILDHHRGHYKIYIRRKYCIILGNFNFSQSL